MATITLPTSPGWQEVEPSYSKNKARNRSPFTNATQTYVWSGENDEFMFALPPMREADAMPWIEKLRELEAGNNHFVADVSKYVSPTVSDKAAMSLRLVGQASVFVGRDKIYHISFSAERDQ